MSHKLKVYAKNGCIADRKSDNAIPEPLIHIDIGVVSEAQPMLANTDPTVAH